MGFFKGIGKVFKSVAKAVKKTVAAPFEAVRDTWRGIEALGQGVGKLAQGDIGGALESTVAAVGQSAKGAITLGSAGAVSDNGYLIDTKVKQAAEAASESLASEEAAVSFAEAGTPSVVVGADEVEEDVLKRKKRESQAGFLGGLSSSSNTLI